MACLLSNERTELTIDFVTYGPFKFSYFSISHSNIASIMLIMQYAKFVKPAFDDFVMPSKKYADVIIPRGGDNHVAIDLIVQHIHTKLGQHNLCKIYPNVNVIQSTFQVCLSSVTN